MADFSESNFSASMALSKHRICSSSLSREEARFLGGSGPDVNRCIYFYILLHGICLRIRTEMVNVPVKMSHPTQSYSLECDGDVIIVVMFMMEIRCADDIFLNICGKSFIKAGEICPKSLVKISFDVTLQLFR